MGTVGRQQGYGRSRMAEDDEDRFHAVTSKKVIQPFNRIGILKSSVAPTGGSRRRCVWLGVGH